MALSEIPQDWRTAVCAVLETEETGTLIEWTGDARRRYESDSNFGWDHQAYHALRAFLSSRHPMGCPLIMKKPTGETYEFYFPFKDTTFYGKILLRPDRQHVVLFSAHRPLKSKLSCE